MGRGWQAGTGMTLWWRPGLQEPSHGGQCVMEANSRAGAESLKSGQTPPHLREAQVSS